MTHTTKQSPLRVGFDMDGVLLYNPARIIRPLVSSIKHIISHKRKLQFYYPKSSFEKWLFQLAHLSSIFNAPGLDDIAYLVKTGKIEAYLITARYNFLGNDVKRWVKKNKLEKIFKGVFYNSKNEQPHEFKERMIKSLDLDIYVEDNFDIVNHIAKKTRAKVVWIYNIFDRNILFAHKAPTLQEAINLFIRNK
jgi:uncharacterized HAD superfamily protein